jgi:4-hydroxy-3-polyprenylbenzoate decarboxylase
MTGTQHDASAIVDLRSALEFLAGVPGQLVATPTPVDPFLELAGVYRRVGAGTPVAPPTRIGPAVLFENVKGFEMRAVAGVLASRLRTALLLGTTPDRLAFELLAALERPIPPVVIPSGEAPCHDVVIRPPFDIRRIIPATTSTENDAGAFLNMALLRAEDPDTGASDVTIHRMCFIGPDTMTVNFTGPFRHIDQFRVKCERAGKPLPVSVSIGFDPAVYVATSFEAPTTPLGFDELTIAGGLRGRPVELVDCVSVPAKALARAEIVIEGELYPNERVREDLLTGKGWAMPEFPGYLGIAKPDVPVMHVTAVTHRTRPIFQTLVGPGEEHVTLAGLPTEASILQLAEDALPGFVRNVYCHPAGGGKYLAILQVRKRIPADEGRQRQAALTAFTAFSELKHVILVDDDVDLYDTNDVLWAMTTRYQGDVSTVFLPGVRCHPLDPSATPEFNPLLRVAGQSCKTIFDCTVPVDLRERFERARFAEVDLSRYEGLDAL